MEQKFQEREEYSYMDLLEAGAGVDAKFQEQEHWDRECTALSSQAEALVEAGEAPRRSSSAEGHLQSGEKNPFALKGRVEAEYCCSWEERRERREHW